MKMTLLSGVLVSLLFMMLPLPLLAEDWPQFRGPTGQGHSAVRNLPLTWSDDSDNLRWKVPIDGLGQIGHQFAIIHQHGQIEHFGIVVEIELNQAWFVRDGETTKQSPAGITKRAFQVRIAKLGSRFGPSQRDDTVGFDDVL